MSTRARRPKGTPWSPRRGIAAAGVLAASVTIAASAPAPAAARPPAETGARLDAPRLPGEPAAPEREREPRPSGAPAEQRAQPTDEQTWRGPKVELFYTRYALAERRFDGRVHAGGFGGYLPTGDFRLGAWGEAGVRRYAAGPNDIVARATLLAGYQHTTDRVTPYAGVVGTLGAVFGKRFHTPVQQALKGAGLEVGVDLRLAGPLWAGLSFSWIRARMRGRHDLLVLRARIGL